MHVEYKGIIQQTMQLVNNIQQVLILVLLAEMILYIMDLGGGGYGLGQWTWYSRKEGLYDLAKSQNASIGDEEIQIKWLLTELSQGGYSRWINAGSVSEASNAFCDIFENPAVKNYSERASHAQRYYDKFANQKKPSTSRKNKKIVSVAESKLGCAYVYGATGPNTFDCSGLVQWVYAQNGISLPRTTYDYEKYIGTSNEVSWNDAQPGDIVWRKEHMGIYLGNDKYIHAPQTGDVVKISQGAKGAFSKVFRFTK